MNSEQFAVAFGHEIATKRRHEGLTLHELADRLGVAISLLYRVEKGINIKPRADVLRLLDWLYGTSNVAGMTHQVLDSGVRQSFETGAVRDIQDGKGRPDLLSPFAQRRVAIVAEHGAKKYGERNWEKGIPLSRFLQSAERHLVQVKAGMTDEDHAAHAIWNLMAFIHTSEMIRRGRLPKTLDDLPDYTPDEES